jgi:hypothetical protein
MNQNIDLYFYDYTEILGQFRKGIIESVDSKMEKLIKVFLFFLLFFYRKLNSLFKDSFISKFSSFTLTKTFINKYSNYLLTLG